MSCAGYEEVRCVVADLPWPYAVDEKSVAMFGDDSSSASLVPTMPITMALAEIRELPLITASLAQLWLCIPAEDLEWADAAAQASGFAPVYVPRVGSSRCGRAFEIFNREKEHSKWVKERTST